MAWVGFLAAIAIGFVNQFAYHFGGRDVIAARIGLPLAVFAIICGVIGCIWVRISGWQYLIAALATLTALATVFTALAHDQRIVDKAWVIAAATLGAVLCAAAANPCRIRATVYWLLSGIICASLIVGAIDLFTGGTSAFRNHYEPRYSEWLGLPVLSGLTGHQNTMGYICAIALTAQLALLRSKRLIEWPSRTFLIVIGPAASVAGLIWSQSRTALGAAVLGVIVAFLPVEKLRGTKWVTIWGAAIAVIVVAPLALGLAGVTSFTGRVEVWRYAIDDFVANSAFGYGIRFMRGDEYWQTKPSFPDLYGAHNQFLDTAGRSGIVGLSCLLGLFIALVAAAWLIRRADGGVAVVIMVVYTVLFTQESLLPVAVTPGDHLRETLFPYLASLALVVAGISLFTRDEAPSEQPVSEEPVTAAGST